MHVCASMCALMCALMCADEPERERVTNKVVSRERCINERIKKKKICLNREFA